jgi:exodeoxyribonuclease VII large subunit
MTTPQVETRIVYTPSSLVVSFGNVLNGDVTRKPIFMKGIYSKKGGGSYGGFYYDTVKDESSDGYMTMLVPASIRASLVNDKTIEFIGYLTKRPQTAGGRIDLVVTIMEVLSQEESKYSDEQLRGFELLQRKAEAGYKDVDGLIRRKVTKGEPTTVNILVGKNAIIDSDIKHQLQEGVGYYKIHFLKINLSSEKEIIEHLNLYSRKCDVIAVARGGGDGLEVFNKPEIVEVALSLQTPLITAIGHEQDVTLLQKVADKAFITPTSLGEYLRGMYNTTLEQLQNTKAGLVEDITRQLKTIHEQQIQVLNNQIEGLKELNKQAVSNTVEVNNKEIALLKGQISDLTRVNQSKVAEVHELTMKVKSRTSLVVTILLVLLGIVLGIILGKII